MTIKKDRQTEASSSASFPHYNSDSIAATTSTSTSKKPFFSSSLVAGACAGIVVTFVCAPLDVAKVRMQVQGSLGRIKYRGMISSLRQIAVEEGVGGFYKGLGPALCTLPLFWGIYWNCYDKGKVFYADYFPASNPSVHHVLAAISAGAIGDVITNPFWVVRTRIQTLILHKESRLPSNISMLGMFRSIYQTDGIYAFYRGLGASFLGLSHVAVQFPLYEYLKTTHRKKYPDQQHESLGLLIGASITAKVSACVFTYPHEVVRSRLQDVRQGEAPSIFKICKDIFRNEGVKSFWSGFQFNLLRTIPATVSTFLTYEYVKRFMRNKDGSDR